MLTFNEVAQKIEAIIGPAHHDHDSDLGCIFNGSASVDICIRENGWGVSAIVRCTDPTMRSKLEKLLEESKKTYQNWLESY